ncbi:MAG: TetR/AcrR family transcriptional regulator [Eggerthellaceae bacterium]|nr:TetR/AcrR family transcriptional regulator [Eggerthellaceae bacterium]
MTKPNERARRTDKRVLRTRKAIINAFDKLVSNSDVEKITVSAIAREAGIDRKTFYSHYNSIDDLANHKTEEILERVIDALKREGEGKPYIERVHIVLTEVNAILTTNISVYANIASRMSTDQVLERFEQVGTTALSNAGFNPDFASDSQIHMFLQFHVAGALSLYASWLRSNRAEPIETVSEAIEYAISASWRDNGPFATATR